MPHFVLTAPVVSITAYKHPQMTPTHRQGWERLTEFSQGQSSKNLQRCLQIRLNSFRCELSPESCSQFPAQCSGPYWQFSAPEFSRSDSCPHKEGCGLSGCWQRGPACFWNSTASMVFSHNHKAFQGTQFTNTLFQGGGMNWEIEK